MKKENIIKDFTKEQMDIYNYYRKQFEKNDSTNYPIAQEDKEIMALEKSYKMLKSIFKIETVLALIIFTVMFLFNGFPFNKSQIKYKHANIENIQIIDKLS